MHISINIPEELYRQASGIAAAENISIDELFAAAFEEPVLELQCLKEKAASDSYEEFLAGDGEGSGRRSSNSIRLDGRNIKLDLRQSNPVRKLCGSNLFQPRSLSRDRLRS